MPGRIRSIPLIAADEGDEADGVVITSPVSLDELHDPKRLWSLGSDNPAELRAEISRLQAELGTYRAALSRPFPVAVLHWPATELAELTAAYPTLATEYPSHEEHLATIEASLRELASSGTPNLGIVTGTVPSYEAFAASEGASPADPTLLPQYATTLAARGRAVEWPPPTGSGLLVRVGANLWGAPRHREPRRCAGCCQSSASRRVRAPHFTRSDATPRVPQRPPEPSSTSTNSCSTEATCETSDRMIICQARCLPKSRLRRTIPQPQR